MVRPTSYPDYVGAEAYPWFSTYDIEGAEVKFTVLVHVNEPRQLGYSDWDVVLVNADDLDRLDKVVMAEFKYPIDVPSDDSDQWVEMFGQDWLAVELGWIEIE